MARVIYILLCLCTFPSTINSSEEVSVTVSDDTVRGDWPTDRIDLKGVEVKLSEGEDVEGSASAKELIDRAFERLPKSEQDRIGFTTLREAQLSLPQSGGIGEDGFADDDETLLKLKELWAKRQTELQEAMDAMQDSANLLSGLIKSLRVGVAGADPGQSDSAATSEDDDTEEALLTVLEDLEDHLSDVDNARDFHDALQGWAPLAAKLAPMTPSAVSAGDEELQSESTPAPLPPRFELRRNSPSVRAAAAMVVGTAIKNEADFKYWILEALPHVHRPATNKQPSASSSSSADGLPLPPAVYPLVRANETVLGALTAMLRGVDDYGFVKSMAAGNSKATAAVTQKELLLMQRRALYAIGSGLRHNPAAQHAFAQVDLGGVEALATAVAPPNNSGGASAAAAERSGSSSSSSAAALASARWALRTKVLALVQDLLVEGVEEGGGGGATKAAESRPDVAAGGGGHFRSEFLSLAWRQLVVRALEPVSDTREGDRGQEGAIAGAPPRYDAPPKTHETALRALKLQWGSGREDQETGGASCLTPLAAQLYAAEEAPSREQAFWLASVKKETAKVAAVASEQLRRLRQYYGDGGRPAITDPEYNSELLDLIDSAIALVASCV